MTTVNFQQDDDGKKSPKQKTYAYKLAMKIRDSGKSGVSSASKLAKWYSIDTLLEAIDEIEAGNNVTFE